MPKKILNGTVISDKPNKTITVVVERKYQHPVLKKVMKARKKYNVHDESNKYKNGDKVSIRECKPFPAPGGPKIIMFTFIIFQT